MGKKNAAAAEVQVVKDGKEKVVVIPPTTGGKMIREADGGLTVDQVVSPEQWEKERVAYNAAYFEVPNLIWFILCIGGLTCLFFIAYSEKPVRHLLPLDALAIAIFKSRANLKVLFNFACLAHFFEAQYAVYVCTSQLGLTSWPFWAVQTFILGYPSLSLLLERRRMLDLMVANRQREMKGK